MLRNINTWIILGCLVIGVGAWYIKTGGKIEAVSTNPAGPQDAVILVPSDDAEMEVAFKQGKDTLDEFLTLYRNPPLGATGFGLKIALADSNGTEYFWIEPFREKNLGFEGTLANVPEIVTSVSYGDQIDFKREDVVDWKYMLDGKMEGNFTLRVLLKHMPASQAEQVKKDAGWK